MNENEVANKDKLQLAFKLVDKDKSGTLSLKEFRSVIQSDSCKLLPASVVEAMLYEFDGDGDGQISFKEFCAMMTVVPEEHFRKGLNCLGKTFNNARHAYLSLNLKALNLDSINVSVSLF